MKYKLKEIVIQPTTLCNLNCSYCYLPYRSAKLKMSIETAKNIARNLERYETDQITIIWHGGEPLATGYNYFSELIGSFDKLWDAGRVSHSIQTNGTLINKSWCRLFTDRNFRVGVSIDGPFIANQNRVDWSNKPAFSKILTGLGLLKENSIPFSIITVITRENFEMAEEIYEFICKTGCRSLGINIEEMESANTRNHILTQQKVCQFWVELFQAWKKNPVIKIREFNKVFSWMQYIQNGIDVSHTNTNLLPTIAWNGDVFILSPEFAGAKSARYSNFIVGNINNKSLTEILNESGTIKYFLDYIDGVKKCESICQYFSYCRGGQASNKYFEQGKLDVTETRYCQNSKQALVEAVLQCL